jgi:hypothetical protein
MVPRFEQSRLRALALAAGCGFIAYMLPARSDAPTHDYPTYARVEYVQECMAQNGGTLAELYKCSCAIDHMAQQLTYDEFVEASTFVHYATAPGEGAGIFRDPDRAKERSKLYRSIEAKAYHSCGLKPPSGPGH